LVKLVHLLLQLPTAQGRVEQLTVIALRSEDASVKAVVCSRQSTAASLLQHQDQHLHLSQLFIQQRHLSQLSPEGSLVSGPHFRCRHFEIQYFFDLVAADVWTV
jgi:hypothetical protein